MGKISPACKAAAKKKFKVWPSAYASGWGVRCTKAGGPGNMGKLTKQTVVKVTLIIKRDQLKKEMI